MLHACANLKAAGQKNPGAHAAMPLGLQGCILRESRKIDGVVHRYISASVHSTAKHGAVVASGAQRKDQRIRLRVANPCGIQTLIKDIEGREETAHGEREISIADIIEFSVFQRLIDSASEVADVAVTALKLAFKLTPRLEKEIVPEGNQQNGRCNQI